MSACVSQFPLQRLVQGKDNYSLSETDSHQGGVTDMKAKGLDVLKGKRACGE